MRRFRAALVGCGNIGSEFADDPRLHGDVFTHAEAYVHCPDTDLIAVCDRDPAKAQRCGERWGVTARYGDIPELMAGSRPEIVSVCTPDHTHYAVARALLEAEEPPRAILCEKPLTTSLAEAHDLIGRAEARGVLLAVAYMRRFARNIRALRDMVAAGEFGRLQGISGWYTKGTLHNGSHWFDLLRMLAGEVQSVWALDRLREDGADPTVDVFLCMEGGTLATLHACDARSFSVFEMDLVGTKGRARLLDAGFQIELSRHLPSPRYSGYTELQRVPHDFGDRRDLMLHAVEDLVQAVRTGGRPACTAEDGLTAMRIGLAALESARTGERVSLG